MKGSLLFVVVGGAAAFAAGSLAQSISNHKSGVAGAIAGTAGAALALFLATQVIRQ